MQAPISIEMIGEGLGDLENFSESITRVCHLNPPPPISAGFIWLITPRLQPVVLSYPHWSCAG